MGVVVTLGSPGDSVVRTCWNYLSPEPAWRHLADHLSVFLGFGRLDKKNVKDCLATRNTNRDGLSWTPGFLSLEGQSGPGWGFVVESMQSLLGTNTSLWHLFHSGCCLFLSNHLGPRHQCHLRTATRPPWGCRLFDWTEGDRGLGTTIPITLSYIQVLYPQS